MQKEPGLKWLFFDLNSYFASVEQQERPHLRGKPVAVVPMPTDSTCAIAASYEAKAYGVKTGTKIYEARRLCPNLQCVLARHDVYTAYHNRIISEVIKHTPINRICSIDELSSRLPPSKRTPEAATRIAMNIKNGLRENIGEAVKCSIGVAPNALLAKIATDMQKPDGLVLISQEDLPDAIFPLRLSDVPGIGANMEVRLHRAGIHTMEDFWNTSPKQARAVWRSVAGERMWYWLHGYDFDPPDTGKVMIGHSRVLEPDLRAPEAARQISRRLLVKASQRLRRQGYYASSLSLSARLLNGQRWGGEARFPHAHDPFTFLEHLEELWSAMLAGTAHLRPRRAEAHAFKKVSVVLHGLKEAENITLDIFEQRTPAQSTAIQKREALAGALDKLQARYHREAVCLGTTPKTLAGHVGTKIAFSRVPDQEEFWS